MMTSCKSRREDNVVDIWYICLHFAKQDGKNWKDNHATKVTKLQKSKRRKYGMNKTFDKQ